MLSKTIYSVPIFILSHAINSLPNFEEKIVLNQPTGNFFYDEWQIKKQFKRTAWDSILESLPFPKGEARIIKLEPGENYLSHADIDDRWHLTLKASNSFLIDLDLKKMHPTNVDGFWYSMDAGKLHTAANFGSHTRYQLVIRKPLSRCSFSNVLNVRIEPENKEQHDYRFVFDNIISPWLNTKNKQGVLTDFSYNENVVEFKIHATQKKDFENIITKDFKVTYD